MAVFTIITLILKRKRCKQNENMYIMQKRSNRRLRKIQMPKMRQRNNNKMQKMQGKCSKLPMQMRVCRTLGGVKNGYGNGCL